MSAAKAGSRDPRLQKKRGSRLHHLHVECSRMSATNDGTQILAFMELAVMTGAPLPRLHGTVAAREGAFNRAAGSVRDGSEWLPGEQLIVMGCAEAARCDLPGAVAERTRSLSRFVRRTKTLLRSPTTFVTFGRLEQLQPGQVVHANSLQSSIAWDPLSEKT